MIIIRNMKKLIVLFIPALLLVYTPKIEAQSNAVKIQLSSEESNIAVKNNDFANRMFGSLCSQQANVNVTFSPLSMEYLLAMTANGASVSSLKEMLTAMNLGNYSLPVINGYYQRLTSSLTSADQSVKLSLANSVWIQKNFGVKNTFMSSMKSVFKADVFKTDFNKPASATNSINRWCSDKTAGLIKKISLDITPELKLVLSNASYFKGEWTTPFDKNRTHKGYFTTEAGAKNKIDMMFAQKRFNYNKQSNYEVVELPYGNKSFSMVLVLPSEGTDVNTLVNTISWNNIEIKPAYVSLTLPKFKVENHWKRFNSTLRSVGIKKIMKEGNQLDNIANDLYVSDVTQDVLLEVNEEGTKAAAVSSAGIRMTAIRIDPNPVTVTFNRPFLFALRENSTGSILFMGKIANL